MYLHTAYFFKLGILLCFCGKHKTGYCEHLSYFSNVLILTLSLENIWIDELLFQKSREKLSLFAGNQWKELHLIELGDLYLAVGWQRLQNKDDDEVRLETLKLAVFVTLCES